MILELWWKDPLVNLMHDMDFLYRKTFIYTKFDYKGLTGSLTPRNEIITMCISILSYITSPMEDIIIRLNTKVNAKNILSFYFPANHLHCNCIKWIIGGRRGNCKSVVLWRGTWITFNFENSHLWAEFLRPFLSQMQPSWCQKILIRLFYSNRAEPLFL